MRLQCQTAWALAHSLIMGLNKADMTRAVRAPDVDVESLLSVLYVLMVIVQQCTT